MSEKYNYRHKNHLLNLIKKRNNDIPNFALFLGAGASISSKVKPTGQMINEWRRQLYSQSEEGLDYEDWLPKQDWFEDDEEYSLLFERVYDQPAQRRIYIEECLGEAKPSWGYIYLANIIAENYFNVIFTSNFDDLINEACFNYADCKPIVCAHDSAVSGIRITSKRPKIIKLHGDFLYDNIRNTVSETDTLEKNMRKKFSQFAKEYGLVVIGYGGSDRSIMEILENLLRIQGYFPHGIYWCLRERSKISRRLNRFLRREKVFTVVIDGFDEIMAELHEELGLTLPDSVRDPYKATTDRINKFIEAKTQIRNDYILQDITELENQVRKFQSILFTSKSGEEIPLPNEFLGASEFRNGNYLSAIKYYEKALDRYPNDIDILSSLAECYVRLGNIKKAMNFVERIRPIDSFEADYLSGFLLQYEKPKSALRYFNRLLEENEKMNYDANYVTSILAAKADILLSFGNHEKALEAAEKALKIIPNDSATLIRAFALKKLNRKAEAKDLVEQIIPIEFAYSRAVAHAIKDDKKRMLNALKDSIKKERGMTLYYARRDPKFEDFRENATFKRLLAKAEKDVEKAKNNFRFGETIETSANLTVDPNPATVGDKVVLQLDILPSPPPTYNFFRSLIVEITKPDGTIETWGPYNSNTEGTVAVIYVPSQVGTHSIKFNYPGGFFETSENRYTGNTSPTVSLLVNEKV